MWLWLTNNTLIVSSPDSIDSLDDEVLKECITEATVDPKKLLNFFKIVEARHENTDQGDHTQ